MRITVLYPGPLSEEKDDQIEKLIRRYGGSVTGSGYGYGGRDISANIALKHIDKFEKALLRKFRRAQVIEE